MSIFKEFILSKGKYIYKHNKRQDVVKENRMSRNKGKAREEEII